MIATPTGQWYQDKGVWISAKAAAQFGAFEKDYLEVRSKEKRVFSIGEIRELPRVPAHYAHAAEWKMRAGSIARFMQYLKSRRPRAQTIVDIGCGNGFFSNILSTTAEKVYGIDVNLTELQQAAAAFGDNAKLQWYYLDVFDEDAFEEAGADLITFCCSFQYFASVERLVARCSQLLKPGGSIHIIDTPFYPEHDLERARTASSDYYRGMGCDTLAQHYFHHTWEKIIAFEPIVHYKPEKQIFSSLFRKKESPFPWIEIRKQ